MCVRCGATMAERGRLGPDAALAFALTGLLLAIPSLLLPFVTLEKFGHERVSHLDGGFQGLWSPGFESVGGLVLFCGILAPYGLLGLLIAVLWTDRREKLSDWNRRFRRWVHPLERWAMPEVQVLGVMVAFFKLGDVVGVSVGPGLWCYSASALFTLLAWRRFNLQPRQERLLAIPGRVSS